MDPADDLFFWGGNLQICKFANLQMQMRMRMRTWPPCQDPCWLLPTLFTGKGVNKAISQMCKEAYSYYLVKTILYMFATCIILRANFLIVYISLLFESVLCSVALRVSHTLLEDGCRALSSIIWGVDAQLRGMFRCDDCDVQPSAGGSRVPIACRDEVYSFIESGDHYLRHHDARGEGIS